MTTTPIKILVGQRWKNNAYGREFDVIELVGASKVKVESVNEPKVRLTMLRIILETQFSLVEAS